MKIVISIVLLAAMFYGALFIKGSTLVGFVRIYTDDKQSTFIMVPRSKIVFIGPYECMVDGGSSGMMTMPYGYKGTSQQNPKQGDDPKMKMIVPVPNMKGQRI